MERHDVFISYRRDLGSHFAIAVRSTLEHAGLDVVVDVDFLRAGREWLPQLEEGIARSRHFVLLLTVGSLARMNEPGDVAAIEVAHAYASGCRIVVLFDDKAARPDRHTVLPDALRSLPNEHMVLYEHLHAKASMQALLAALEADSKSRRKAAEDAFERIDAAVRDAGFQAWQTERIRTSYAADAARLGWSESALYFPQIRGRRYPVVCFESALGDGPFTHARLGPPRLHGRSARELPALVVDPEAPIPSWVADHPTTRRYFELLSYARRVRRWNMRGFALAALHLDAGGRVTGFDARVCTYGENCLTSHVLGFDLLESWRQDGDRPGLARPPLDAVLRIDGDGFLPLISVQAIVAFRDEDGTWRVITMMRAGNLAAASGFWQFPPAGGFEIFGNEAESESYVRQQFDIRMALMREFLEEIFGDVEMACEAPDGSGGGQEGSKGYRFFLKALRAGQASIDFLGVVTELVSLRPEFSFLVVIDDVEHFLDGGYSHTLPGGDVAEARWLMSRSETKRLETNVLSALDDLLADERNWHSSSMGMLLLLARVSRDDGSWLRRRYPDFPRLSLD